MPKREDVFLSITWPDQLAVHHLISHQVFAAWALHMGEDYVDRYLGPMGYTMQNLANELKRANAFQYGSESTYTYEEYQQLVFRTAFTGMLALTDLGERLLQKAMEQMPNWVATLSEHGFRQQFLQAQSAIMEVERGDAPNNRDMVQFFDRLDNFLDLDQMEKEFI